MEKKVWTDYLLTAVKVLFTIVFAICILYLIIYSKKHAGDGMIPTQIELIDSWNYQIEGQEEQNGIIPIKADSKRGETVIFWTTLPDNISDGEYISTLNSKNIVIEINGEVRYEWTREEAGIPGGPTHSSYIFVPVYGQDSNGIIKITKYGDTYNGALNNVVLGQSHSVVKSLEEASGPWQFFLAMFIFGISFVIVFCSFIVKIFFRKNITTVSVALGAMAASAWLMFNSYEFQFVFNVKIIGGFLSYVMAMAMPFPFIIYIDKIQKSRYKNFHVFICIVELFNFFTCTTLHVLKIVNYYDSLSFMNGVIVVIIACAFSTIVYDFFKGHIYSYINSAIGLIIFMILSAIEVLFLKQVHKPWGEGMLIEIGLLILLILAIAQQIIDVYVIEKERSQEYEANVARNEFLANMSHEIRTPLNAILGMNEMIMQENQLGSVREYSEHISHAGQVLLSLVNEVLDYSSLQEGKDFIEENNYNPRLMIESIAAVLRDNAESKGLGLNVGMPGDLPETICGDERHIVRILTNLCSNAVKFTDKGSITFATECEETQEGYMLSFYIKDTGMGIKKEDLKMLFSPFNRVDLKNNRSRDGAGLGLAIAKTLVVEMGGEINAESEFGEGSTFIVKIPQKKARAIEEDSNKSQKPRLDDDLESPELSENERDTEQTNKAYYQTDCTCILNEEIEEYSVDYIAPKANVLAVDDNNANLIVVKEFLRKSQINLETVVSGDEAIERCKVKKYDIILMDHMMPEPDGIATMHVIRDSLESINRKTTIIVLTANVIGDCKNTYLAEGFDGYLSKPVDRVTLLKVIRQFLKEDLIEEVTESESQVTEVTESKAPSKSEEDAMNDNGIIDFPGLYARFEGQKAVVNMILSECIKEGERKIVLLQELYDSNDIERYAVEAHGVKGVMASICANQFSAHAKEHEFAAKEKRVDFITEDIASLLKEYREVLDFIKDYLVSEGVEVAVPKVVDGSGDNDSIDDIIFLISQALDDFDVDEALKQIDRLESKLPSDKKAIFDQIKQYTDDFEYDLALESLKMLQE